MGFELMIWYLFNTTHAYTFTVQLHLDTVSLWGCASNVVASRLRFPQLQTSHGCWNLTNPELPTVGEVVPLEFLMLSLVRMLMTGPGKPGVFGPRGQFSGVQSNFEDYIRRPT